MHPLFDLLLFSAKSFVLVFSVLLVVFGLIVLSSREPSRAKLKITKLNHRYQAQRRLLEHAKQGEKKGLSRRKLEKEERVLWANLHRTLFVLDFLGDVRAQATDRLTYAINAILQVATPEDEVLLRVESAGGVMHGYGLAAAQLTRFREAGIPLTVAIDKVAASGGYLMACVADRVLAAPFAVVGSIGVVAELPNVNRWLKKHDVDFEQFTAGKFKRTVSVFAENTKQGKEKFQQELEEAHVLFQNFVSRYRPQMSIEKVATGEHWFGFQGLELGLVDTLITSDDYLLRAAGQQKILAVEYHKKKPLSDRIMDRVGGALADVSTIRW